MAQTPGCEAPGGFSGKGSSHGARKVFQRFAEAVARPTAFVLTVVVVAAWAVTGPVLHFGDTRQLAIDTGTTVVTFLTVFLIRNTQNRDSAAPQIKLGERIRSSAARSARMHLAELDEAALDRLRRHDCRLAHEAAATAADDIEQELAQAEQEGRS